MASPQKKEPENKFFISTKNQIRDRIIIHDNPNIPKEGVSLGLNGIMFLAKPNVEIDIPRAVRRMLDTRVYTQTAYDDDGMAQSRDVPRITYTLVKENVGRDGGGLDRDEDEAGGQDNTLSSLNAAIV